MLGIINQLRVTFLGCNFDIAKLANYNNFKMLILYTCLSLSLHYRESSSKQKMVKSLHLISSVIHSLTLWLLLNIAHAKQHATVLMIDANAAPETNSSLQYHLCGLGNRELDSDTTLSGGVHHLEEGSFCLLQNLKNFTIRGQQTQPRTVIYCHSETEMRRGIAFFNISTLQLSHFEIINCGREVPTGLPGHVNNTFAYLGPLQKAVMIITHSTNVIVESISFDKCLGFAILFINPLGKTLISNASVTSTSSQSRPQSMYTTFGEERYALLR